MASKQETVPAVKLNKRRGPKLRDVTSVIMTDGSVRIFGTDSKGNIHTKAFSQNGLGELVDNRLEQPWQVIVPNTVRVGKVRK